MIGFNSQRWLVACVAAMLWPGLAAANDPNFRFITLESNGPVPLTSDSSVQSTLLGTAGFLYFLQGTTTPGPGTPVANTTYTIQLVTGLTSGGAGPTVLRYDNGDFHADDPPVWDFPTEEFTEVDTANPTVTTDGSGNFTDFDGLILDLDNSGSPPRIAFADGSLTYSYNENTGGEFDDHNGTVRVRATAPSPGTLALLLAGGITLGVMRRRRKA
jgi:hypothetical protein